MKKILLLPAFIFALLISEAQNVGIGTTNPVEKLHVAGNLKADTIKPSAVMFTPNAGTGKILTSDAAGNASWQASSIGGSVGFGPWGDCSTNGISEYNPVVDTSIVPGGNFGYSVSISGNYAIVGAPFDVVGNNPYQGSASIFQYNGSNWVLMQKITDATGFTNDYFGYSVSISGNYAIVGAYLDDVGANPDQGSASIFQLSGGIWVLMNKISDGTGAAGDQFGYSVSVSGNFAIVGARLDDFGANLDRGSASIFQTNGNTWGFMQKIPDATGAAGDQFGYSASISGNYAIVGAPFDDVGANADQGSASVFQLSGGIWILMNKITDGTGAASDLFGVSVSISGNYAIVGAVWDDVGANIDQGSASIFILSAGGTLWFLMQKITDATGAAGDHFGYGVSISGNYAIVGAPFDYVGTYFGQGSSTIFQRLGQGWRKLQYITDPAGSTNDYFGKASSIDGSSKRFLIGAYGYVNNNGKAVFGKVN